MTIDATPGTGKDHRTVSRVTTILEMAARADSGVRLPELAAVLQAPKSSVHSLARGLVAEGFLREINGTYRLGSAINALLVDHTEIAESVRAGMRALHAQTQETVVWVLPVGRSVVYVAAIESTQPIRYTPVLRKRRPLYPTSSGKCYLAYSSAGFRDGYLAEHLPDTAAQDAASAELAEITAVGVAINRGETLPDLYAVSAPVFDESGLSAVLTVAGPSRRFRAELDRHVEGVISTARSLSPS